MVGHTNKKWTPEEDALLRALIEAGNPPMLVALKLKRTLKAIRGRAQGRRISFKRIKVSPKARR